MLCLDMCLYKLENIYCSKECKKSMLIYNIRVLLVSLQVWHGRVVFSSRSPYCSPGEWNVLGMWPFLCSCGFLETCLEWGTTGALFLSYTLTELTIGVKMSMGSSITSVLCYFSCVLGIFVNVVNVLLSEQLILWVLYTVCVWINTQSSHMLTRSAFICSKLQLKQSC